MDNKRERVNALASNRLPNTITAEQTRQADGDEVVVALLPKAGPSRATIDLKSTEESGATHSGKSQQITQQGARKSPARIIHGYPENVVKGKRESEDDNEIVEETSAETVSKDNRHLTEVQVEHHTSILPDIDGNASSRIQNKRRALAATKPSNSQLSSADSAKDKVHISRDRFLMPQDSREGTTLQAIHAQSSAETSGFGSFGDALDDSKEVPVSDSQENLSLAPNAAQQLGLPAASPKRKRHDHTSPNVEMRELEFRQNSNGDTTSHFQDGSRYLERSVQFQQIPDDKYHDDEDKSEYKRIRNPHKQSSLSRNGTLDEDELEQLTSPRRYSHSGARKNSATQSAWMQWSEARRNSYRRRQKLIEERLAQEERSRTPTPVKKARKESLKFVNVNPHNMMENMEKLSPDNIEEEEERRLQQQAARVRTATRMRQKHDWSEVKHSMNNWNTLVSFWEHPVFVKCRYAGIGIGVLAIICGIISLTNPYWSSYYIKQAPTSPLEAHNGLFMNCSTQGGHDEHCATVVNRDWQNAVIGLLIFSLGFGFLATVLSICGVCNNALAKKIYYYHSAGEIYLICALACSAALVTYPVALQIGPKLPEHSYGFGYGLGWGASICFLAAAICMSVDDMVRHLSERWPSWCPNVPCCQNQNDPHQLNHV